jgi:hypothetical protein
MRRASWISLGIIVTLLAWMAAKLVSSNRPTRYASAASWRASTALDWNLRSVLKSWAISRTSLWKGSLRMSSSVDFWYFLISRRATVPGRYLRVNGAGQASRMLSSLEWRRTNTPTVQSSATWSSLVLDFGKWTATKER